VKYLNSVKIIVFCLLFSGFILAKKPVITYPVSKKVDRVDDYFGTKVAAPYRWLEDMNSTATAQWIEAQRSVTNQYFSQITFRSKFKSRLTELWNYESYSTPEKEGEYYIFKMNDGSREQSVVYMQKGLKGKPEVLIDPNRFSKDGSISLQDYAFSKDQKYVCYAVSPSGSDWRELFVMEVKTRKKLKDHIKWAKFTDLSWYKNGFFYSRYDKPKENEKLKAKVESQKLYYHLAGTPQSQDKLVYQDRKNSRLGFSGEVTDNEKYLVIYVWEGASDHDTIYYKNLETGSAVTPVIDKNLRGHFTFVDEIDDRFLVITDYKAPNYKLVLIDPQRPQTNNWKVVIPESTDKLEAVSCVGDRVVALYLKDANSALSVFDLEGKKLYDIKLPGIGTVRAFNGKKDEIEAFYSFSSFIVPKTIYRFNVKENKSEVFRKPDVKFDPGRFETRQVFCESKDKTRVPLFIVHQKGIKLNGNNPTMLYAYGGFNASMKPRFRLHIIPLLESGGVYVTACLRGGGEYGEEWHRAGMLEKKQNVFDDFIAAAQYLIKSGYTSPQKLAIQGGSNGGLLVGAVMNQRPELFRVAIPGVGVMDMLRFHKFTIGWAWAGEYGSSENAQHFKFLYEYSPLHNIKEGIEYPATLVTTADHDDRVFPAHSFKYVAALQEKYKGKNPVLIRIDTKAGHSGASALSGKIARYADIYSFMLYNMKVKPVFHQ